MQVIGIVQGAAGSSLVASAPGGPGPSSQWIGDGRTDGRRIERRGPAATMIGRGQHVVTPSARQTSRRQPDRAANRWCTGEYELSYMECDFPRVIFDIGGPEINPLEKITPEVTSSPQSIATFLTL